MEKDFLRKQGNHLAKKQSARDVTRIVKLDQIWHHTLCAFSDVKKTGFWQMRLKTPSKREH